MHRHTDTVSAMLTFQSLYVFPDLGISPEIIVMVSWTESNGWINPSLLMWAGGQTSRESDRNTRRRQGERKTLVEIHQDHTRHHGPLLSVLASFRYRTWMHAGVDVLVDA